MKKFVYGFHEGTAGMKSLLGGKGANLAEMTRIGLPVPSGFTVTTEACNQYYEEGAKLWNGLKEETLQHLAELEEKMGKKLGAVKNPLLVSVRSGSAISMPGMMDTILNLGLNDASVEGLAEGTANPRFAYDSYRRFIQMFSDVVLEIPKYKFDAILDNKKVEKNVEEDTDLTAEDLKDIIEKYKAIVKKECRADFPQDVKDQLFMAIEAVFKSWNNPRANVYRKLNDIPHSLGTAVNIQSMVFGNMGETSGTGVAFTRDPSTGEKKLFGEFLMNAQGEDVVAGIRTPKPILELQNTMPQAYDKFLEVANLLEEHYTDMQDIEFTIENQELYILQTRNGKRTALAAVNIAVDMVKEGRLTKEEAILRVDPLQVEQLLHPAFDEKELEKGKIITKGLPASSGAATGKIYFTPEDVVEANNRGERAILVRAETSPEDIEGMVASQGILTARGGMTSHAAVVARGMGKCCIAGAGEMKIQEANKIFMVGETVYHEGEYISLDGNEGIVYEGEIATKESQLTDNFLELMTWADAIRTLKIRTNADTPRDTKQAIEFGAEGIGLCRTEHMFFEESRIFVMRKMILSRTEEERRKALAELLPMQREDFVEIFKAMGNRPVTVRLLDPPLHEFLPHEEEDIQQLAQKMQVSFTQLQGVVNDLKEMNPMLGHRGCRLAVTYPEIYEMQVRAIIEAAVIVKEEEGIDVVPEIMIPLVGELKELQYNKEIVLKIAKEVLSEKEIPLQYLVGTMIEVPRAAVTADEIATEAEFFSFGTNDLTQMTFGYSRDDAGKFIKEYREKNILEKDPFQRIDRKGVGKLMELASKLGKETRPNIKLGICGEHGGDPDSIEFCHILGLDYVSCSPYRVPVARLAAARAAIINKEQAK
ncbi:pyruvate, phosphate dikinase PpdK [Clostridium aceticum]|uniref:Pyruvate, phosphate dikinase n=1 Tax=Clostridium aceticum TaxID=84022 RepID=A0A0D8I6K4_9CLOT|nr:pyruvate, phosphate dikinase [Clostridium aceticum]AKL95777.1 pyruvate, phosphate dikinase PpdK [Clostridium aceticum]KJF25677.1 pyruvate phosphate dikinase [Clostridium aceticum]